MTNADMIRSMNDDQLLRLIFATQHCNYCMIHDYCDRHYEEVKNCKAVIRMWLQEGDPA